MVVTAQVKLPEHAELTVDEVNMSTATLIAAAPHLGKACESINNEFMLCREEHKDPRRCIDLGKRVTACTRSFFQRVKSECLHEFNQYLYCMDKSSTCYEPWHCRKTQAVFDDCMCDKMGMARPGFGYFARGRVHKSLSPKSPNTDMCCTKPDLCDVTPTLPDSKERKPARFGSRLYWFDE